MVDINSVSGLGLDIGLRHGTLAWACWDLSKEKPTMLDYEIISQWTGRNGLNERSEIPQIREFSQQIYSDIAKHDLRGIPMAIDWDSRSGFWGRRMAAATLAFFVGYLTRTVEQRGIPVMMLSPDEVREHFGLRRNAQKETIWEIFRGNTLKVQRDDWTASDLRDALVLSYLVAQGVKGESQKASKARLSLGQARN